MNAHPDLSGYQIIEELYTGTRTLVYRGICIRDQQPVIIKILRNEYPNFNELVLFRNQYTITKNLDFSHIIKPLTLEVYHNSYALVMEDFGGVSLSTYLQMINDISKINKVLPLAEFLEIALQLADILNYLYQNRVIHKDIKPANILINPETKEVKLIDFSISSLLPRETQEIQNPNVLEGTLSYISPEQTGRMNRGIDYRSDFYSLGVTFYELLTGELPFVSTDAMELVHCHLAKQPKSIHEIKPEIPLVLSQIVSKLMAKNAENRYQTALGLKHDLEICLEQLQTTSNIETFKLGERDISDRFTIPEKLYGRTTEVQSLLQAFDRVANGASELMLVAGFSGIGKTAVINEVHKPIVRQRGYFIKGKFDQFNRNIPLSVFVQALRDLMGQLLSESDTQLAQWQAKILAVLGENGQVLIEVIPELEQIIGKQPPAPELSGSAAQNRFNLLFPKFIQVFTTIEHPLAIFLDDLQWADLASLQLIELLMNDNGYLLMLGAYRDNEVSPAHPFMLTVEKLRKAQAIVNTITLAPLVFEDTNHLIADTLNCARELAQPLTKLIDRKAQGNPFFTTQFLKALHEEGQIRFDRDRRYWICDIAKVREMVLTDDVVEFMALQLQKLPEVTQQVLKLAACVGNQFDLATLAIVSERSPTDAATALWKALQEGLILPTSQVYKFFQSTEPSDTPNSANPIYRFLHDRVQQAAYLLIPEEQKQITHLAIGQLLLQNTDKAQQNERIFEIVNQLNYGISLISSLARREQYAQLNLRAGRKAKESTAYSAAQYYLAQGIQLLKASDWDVNPDLMQGLYEEAAEVALLNCDFEQMESLIQVVLQQTTTLLGQVKVYEVKLQAYKFQNQQLQAITIGREILQKLGVNFPESVTSLEIQQYVENTLASLPTSASEELVNFPVMQDANALAALRIMTSLVPSVHQAAPHLFPIIACEEVNLSLKYGNSPFSAPGYADFGIVVSTVLNKLEEGYQFGQLALKIMDKFSEKSVQSMTQFKVAAFNQSNRKSIQEAINLLKESYQVGLETGDSVHSLVSTSFRLMYTYLSGAEGLETLLEELAIYQAKFATSQHFLSWAHILHYSIKNLTEFSETPSCLGSDPSDEADYVARVCKANDELAFHLFYLCKLMLSFLFRNIAIAIQDADAGEKYLKAGMGMPSAPVYYYYDSLARLTLYPTVDPSQQVTLLSQVETNQAKLGIYVSATPINYQHKYFLVEALRYCILGNRAEAIDLYDRAIAGAKVNGYIQEEALANELTAKFYLNWGKEKVAAGYMQEAYYCYARWGAKAKVIDLEQYYPQLLAPILQQSRATNFIKETFRQGTISVTKTSGSISEVLDLATLLKASQAISGEIELNKLLTNLLEIVIANAGASKCVLLLKQDTDLKVVAFLEDGKSQQLLPSISLESSADVPISLVNTVKRTLSPLVLFDTRFSSQFAGDSYIQKHQPKSVLCSPILNQGQLIGVLYLENNVTVGAFTSDRVELLNLLCTQAAISLENARLYERSLENAQQLEESLNELSASNSRFHNLVDNVPGVVYQYRMSADGVISLSYISANCYNLLEITPEQAMSNWQFFTNMVHPDDIASFLQSQTHTIQTESSWHWEGRIITPSGIIKWIHGESRIQRFADGSIVWDGLYLDISDRKQAELALQNNQLQMIQSEKMSALGNLVAGVAHEINNPICFLSGNITPALDYINDLFGLLDLVQQKYPQLEPEIQEQIETIELDYIREDLPKLIESMQAGVKRIQDISISLRTFSRADSDRPVACNIHDGIDSTIMILKHRLKANESRPEIEVIKDYSDLPTIECYAGQLNQVFMNILANAIDALDEFNIGRSYADIKATHNQIIVKTELSGDRQQVVIRIKDNGIGMNESVREKVFNNLFTTKSVGKGTGLGLAIARQIVEEKHGGSLQVNSILGEGTEFIITLPIKAE